MKTPETKTIEVITRYVKGDMVTGVKFLITPADARAMREIVGNLDYESMHDIIHTISETVLNASKPEITELKPLLAKLSLEDTPKKPDGPKTTGKINLEKKLAKVEEEHYGTIIELDSVPRRTHESNNEYYYRAAKYHQIQGTIARLVDESDFDYVYKLSQIKLNEKD